MRLEWTAAKTFVAIAATIGMLGGGLVPAGADTTAPVDCPEVMPVDQLQRGMMAKGFTVSRGTEPEPFSAEVLGVLENGIGPGRDMIMVDAHSPEIDRVGGIWYGMSGSPVYLDGKLLGAVAYGLSFGPSTVAGLTPAEDMMDILDYPKEEDDVAAARTVHVPRQERRSIAESTDTPRDEVGSDFHQLKLPVSISGLSPRAMHRVAKMLDRENAPVVPYAGSSVAAGETAAPGDVHAGDNFAATLSYGDISYAGVGTTTLVCDGMAVSFGHPFDFVGATELGANQADAITIVKDPIFGAFKLANVTAGVGTLDQDRLAGVRSELGVLPALVPITSTVTAENNGRSRTGETDVVDSDYVPFLAYYHAFENILVTMDEYSEGTADVTWTINGTREDGSTWTFNRTNAYTSRYAIAYEAPYELLSDLYALYYNGFEEVEFSSVDFDATVKEEIEQYRLRGVKASINDGDTEHGRRLRVRPGDVITLSETLRPLTPEGEKNDDPSQDQTITQTVVIPENAKRDGTLQVTGGQSDYTSRICLYRPRRCNPGGEDSIESFDDYLAALLGLPHNNDVVTHLYMGRRGRIVATTVTTVDRVVSGRKYFLLRLRGGRRGGSAEGTTTEGGKGTK